MNAKAILSMTAFATCAITATGALAQAKPATLVKQRQAVMTLHGKYFYSIRPMAQGKIPYDAAIVVRNVGYLDALSKMPWDGFNPNTKDIKTGATPTVYTDAAKFKELADVYMAETTKLAALTKGGDEAAIKAQILAVDKTCNSCHEGFRERE
jgi:adenylosuccinate lyase